MAAIPGYLSAGPSGSTGQQAVDSINSLRDLLGQTAGLFPWTTVTIASGVIAPWVGTGGTITAGAALRIDTEGGAAADDLDRIQPTGLLDPGSSQACRLLLLTAADPARIVTIRHAQGGTGELRTPDGANWQLRAGLIVLALWVPASTSWQVLGWLTAPVDAPHALRLRADTWTAGSRPSSPPAGRLGLATDVSRIEYYTGSAWRRVLTSEADYEGTVTLQAGAVAYAAINHGLGVRPTRVQLVLECLTAEYGYSAGDEVSIEAMSANDRPVITVATRSTTSILLTQRTTPRVIDRSSPGSQPEVTVANWRWRVRAWR